MNKIGQETYLNIDDTPPWYICFFVALQHYLLTFVSLFTTPFFYASAMCLDLRNPDVNDIVNAIFLISGITTLLQSTVGTRLPIVQGPSFAFLLAALAVLNQPEWRCPESGQQANSSSLELNDNASFTLQPPKRYDDIWKRRMGEISGDIMVAAGFQIVLGASGLIGVMLRHTGPMTIAPVITVLGMALFEYVATICSQQWAVSMSMVVLITIMSQLMGRVYISRLRCCAKQKHGRKPKEDRNIKFTVMSKLPVFSVFSFIISMIFVWFLCYIFTISGVFGDSPDDFGYNARTDLRSDSLKHAKWFRIPYPFQFGTPTASLSGILAMFAAVIASVIESVGDYYACAKVSRAPPPPTHAINRGIMAEGFGCLLSGMFGTGIGSTSYSHNIALLSLTKVACRRVIQLCAAITIIMALFGKFAALFVTIPLPVVGGMVMVMSGVVTAVGLSNLQYVDLNSTRNLYILGFSIFMGLCIPFFLSAHPDYIQTGYTLLDQIFTVLLQIGMLVAGVVAFLLDNIVPGTRRERGLLDWGERAAVTDDSITATLSTYNLPYIDRCLKPWTAYLPFCQTFRRFNYDHGLDLTDLAIVQDSEQREQQEQQQQQQQ